MAPSQLITIQSSKGTNQYVSVPVNSIVFVENLGDGRSVVAFGDRKYNHDVTTNEPYFSLVARINAMLANAVFFNEYMEGGETGETKRLDQAAKESNG